jgi:hypothetical protein
MGMLIRPGDMNYYDLPWEIEAHGREYGLYDRFLQQEAGVVLPPAMISPKGLKCGSFPEETRVAA